MSRKRTVMIGEAVDEQSSLHIFPVLVFESVRLAAFADMFPISQVLGFKEDSSSKLAIHHAEVYHTALGIVFADLELPAEHGTVFKFCDTFQSGIPIFMVVSADYKEMYVVVSAFITNEAYGYSQGSHLRDIGLQ